MPDPTLDIPSEADSQIEQACAALRRDELVAFPTETVYGLGALARSERALGRLYAVKGRPTSHPVIVHLASARQLPDWAEAVPPVAQSLAEALWPGPLTLVLKRRPDVPAAVSGGLPTIGLRVPRSPLALELLERLGDGIAAPSANRFGKVSPTTAAHVREELGSEVALVLDGGPCQVGIESTIVDLTGPEPAVLRLGGLTLEALAKIAGRPVLLLDRGPSVAPGMLVSHYAPRARVELVAVRDLARRSAELVAEGLRHGLLALDLVPTPREAVRVGAPTTVEELARALYDRLREADRLALEVLLAVPPEGEGLAAAVRDRLSRAAAPR